MYLRTFFFRCLSGLSRRQKRFVFLAVDMLLAPLAATGIFAGAGLYNLLTCVFLTVLAGGSSIAFGLPRVKLKAYGRHAVLATAKFSVLVALGLFFLAELAEYRIDLVRCAEFGTLLFLACVGSRYSMLVILVWALRAGQKRCRVLIYGAGNTGQQIAAALRDHQSVRAVAFLDDDLDLQAVTVAGLPVLSPARLEKILQEQAVDKVVLAIPSASAAKLAQITRKLRLLNLDVQALPSFAQLIGAELTAPAVDTILPAQLLGRNPVADDMPNIDAVYRGRVIFISGAGGSVGSELCRQLMAHAPKALILFERSEIALYTIERQLRELAQGQPVQIIPVLGSISDACQIRDVMTETATEIVFHAAAYKHLPLIEANPVAGLSNNVLGTRVLAETAASVGVAQFVLISTDKAVRPSSIMGATKRLAELVVQDLAKKSPNTLFSTVRFGNVLGSSGSVLPLFRDQIAHGGPVTLTHDDVTRYFMTLPEAAKLVLVSGAFASLGRPSDAFVLDMGSPIKIRNLAERMIKAEGLTLKNAKNPYGDIEIVVTGLRQGEKLHEELLIDGQYLPTPHPKIMLMQQHGLSEFAMAAALKAINVVVKTGDQQAARATIAAWIDGFPSAAPAGRNLKRTEGTYCSA